MKTAKRSCPICENRSAQELFNQHFELPEGHPLNGAYEVVVCSKCGFVYADTAISQDAYELYYSQNSKYEDAQTGTGGGEKAWDRSRLDESAREIGNFLKDPRSRILDVGCANGGLLKSLLDIGYSNLFGIDPSAVCVRNVRSFGIEAEVGSFSQPISKKKFDCVILSHTLEHVQDVCNAMKWVDAALTEGTNSCIYIEVPNASRYVDFIFAPFQDFNTEHINHFSINSLINLLHNFGFDSVKEGEKIIESAPNMPYPAIFSFAKRSINIGGEYILFDSQLALKIEDYIRFSRSLMKRIYLNLSNILSRNRSVIVWGTGQLLMKLLCESPLKDANITSFVDNNPINTGKRLRGVPIIAPENILPSDDPIIITSILHQKEIIDQIQELHLSNEIMVLRDL